MLCASVGTALLVFVPSAAWLRASDGAAPFAILRAYALKQVLTVSLLLIVPALWTRCTQVFGLWTLPALALLAFGVGYALSRDVVTALYGLLLVGLPGVALYVFERIRLSNFRAVIYESFFVLFALFGYVCLRDLIRSEDAYLPFRNVIELIEKQLETLRPTFTLENGETDAYFAAILDLLSTYRLNAEVIGVPILTVPAMAAGLSNVLFTHVLNRRGGADIRPLPAFSVWRCERLFVIVTTVLALGSYLLAMFNVNGMAALSGVASLIWRFPCALAGLSAVYGFCAQLHKKWIFVIVCCATAAVPNLVPTMLAIIGMLASLRKPTTDRKDGTTL